MGKKGRVKKEWRAGTGAIVGLKWSAGLDWKPGVVARRRKLRPGPKISKQLTLSGTGVSLLLEIKRERRHLLDRRGKMKVHIFEERIAG